MRIVCIVAAAFLAGLLSGCASSGVQVTEQQAQTFQVGKSTYPEVVSALGEPTTVSSSSNGNRIAVYSYAAMASRPQNFIPYIGPLVSGYDTKSSAVTFVFDSKGILRETSSTQNNMGSGANLAATNPQGGANPLMPSRQ
jgi:outer membrane protein assembly factor BamE (lipoprotein component of BamABCDE complex)